MTVDIDSDRNIYHLSSGRMLLRKEQFVHKFEEMDSESVSSIKSTSFSGRSLLSRRTMSSAASSADPRFRKTPVAPQVKLIVENNDGLYFCRKNYENAKIFLKLESFIYKRVKNLFTVSFSRSQNS